MANNDEIRVLRQVLNVMINSGRSIIPTTKDGQLYRLKFDPELKFLDIILTASELEEVKELTGKR